MFKSLEGFYEKSREKLFEPREVCFENDIKLVTKISEDIPNLKFMKNGEQIFDLVSLAPEGTKIFFKPENEWSAIPEKKEIYIGKFSGADCVLSFLHEAGHLHLADDAEIANSAILKHHEELFKDIENSFPPSRLRALSEEKKRVIQCERSAWAYSLWQARKLEKEHGIKIFEKIGNSQEIRNFVNRFLETYENGYLDQLAPLEIFTKNEMEKFFKNIEDESNLASNY